MTLERNLVLIFGSNVQPGVAMTPHKMLRGPATLTTKCSAEYGCAFGTMQERIGLFRIGMLRQDEFEEIHIPRPLQLADQIGV